MRCFLSWLWQHRTAERLAVAVFLTVAVGLWWGMQSQPDVTFSIPKPLESVDESEPWQRDRCLFSPDGSMLVVCKPDQIRVFELVAGTELYHTKTLGRQVEWSAEQKLFLTRGKVPREGNAPRGLITLLDPRTGSLTDCFDHPQLDQARFLVAPDGKTLAIHGSGKTCAGLWLFDVASRKELASTLLGTFDLVSLQGFSPDGRYYLIGVLRTDGGELTLYDTWSGKVAWQRGKLRHIALPDRYAFSPDSRTLALCHEKEMVVHLWDTATGQAVGTIPVGQAITPHGRIEQDQVIHEMCFVQQGSLLCVITCSSHDARRESIWPPKHRTLWPSDTNLNLFEVRTGRLVDRQMSTSTPQPNRADTFLAMESLPDKEWPTEKWTIRVRDLQQGREHAWTMKPRYMYDDCFGFVPWRPGREVLIYSDRYTTLNPQVYDHGFVGFLDPVTGRMFRRWYFASPTTKIMLAPDGKWLLVGHSPAGWYDVDEVFELYAFPTGRPWRHIFGWALVAALTVELLGLGRRGLMWFIRWARRQRNRELAWRAARKKAKQQ